MVRNITICLVLSRSNYGLLFSVLKMHTWLLTGRLTPRFNRCGSVVLDHETSVFISNRFGVGDVIRHLPRSNELLLAGNLQRVVCG